jgi:hypothetical protein
MSALAVQRFARRQDRMHFLNASNSESWPALGRARIGAGAIVKRLGMIRPHSQSAAIARQRLVILAQQ